MLNTEESGVLVVGAGPAGMSAALWLHELEIPFRWIDAGAEFGGTLLRVGNQIWNYPGVPSANGRELAEVFAGHCRKIGLEPTWHSRLDEVRVQETLACTVTSGDDLTVLPVRHLIVATGTAPRLLGLPEEQSRLERGLEISVTRRRDHYAGREVVITGGGDAAFEGALLLAERCPRVTLVCRGQQLRAQRRFVEAVAQSPQIALVRNNEVVGVSHGNNAQYIDAVHLRDGSEIAAAGLFVRIGVRPRIPRGLENFCDESGYATRPDDSGRSWRLLFCGDVASPNHQSVSAAVGQAAAAVAEISAERNR